MQIIGENIYIQPMKPNKPAAQAYLTIFPGLVFCAYPTNGGPKIQGKFIEVRATDNSVLLQDAKGVTTAVPAATAKFTLISYNTNVIVTEITNNYTTVQTQNANVYSQEQTHNYYRNSTVGALIARSPEMGPREVLYEKDDVFTYEKNEKLCEAKILEIDIEGDGIIFQDMGATNPKAMSLYDFKPLTKISFDEMLQTEITIMNTVSMIRCR